MKIRRRQLIASLIALAALPSVKALADRRGRRGGRGRDHHGDHHDEYDHKRADQARRSGEVVPLREILSSVREAHQGEIVGIEFQKKGGAWIYEIKMVAADGRYIEIHVDAKSNRILKVEGK